MVKAFLELQQKLSKAEHAKVGTEEPNEPRSGTGKPRKSTGKTTGTKTGKKNEKKTTKSTSEAASNSVKKRRRRIDDAYKTTMRDGKEYPEVLCIPRAEFRSIFEDFEAIRAQAFAIIDAGETGIPELDDLRTRIQAILVDMRNQEQEAAKWDAVLEGWEAKAAKRKADRDSWELISNTQDGASLVKVSDSTGTNCHISCEGKGAAQVELQSAKVPVNLQSKDDDALPIEMTAKVMNKSWTEVGASERGTQLDVSLTSPSQESKSGHSGGQKPAEETESELLEEVIQCDHLLNLTTLVKRRNYIFLPSNLLIYTRRRTIRIDNTRYWHQSCLHALGETTRLLWKMARHILQVRTLTIKGSWDPAPSALLGRMGKVVKHDVDHPDTTCTAWRAEVEGKQRIDACRYLAGLLVLMAKLESFAWETELPFSKVLWHALPIASLQILSINLERFGPTEGVGDVELFTIQDLQPLCRFINLRQLSIDGMERSYQPVIWQAVWSMPKLRTLSMSMAQPPCMKPELQQKWPMIDDRWRLRQDDGTLPLGLVPLASNGPARDARRVTEWVTEQRVRTSASSTDYLNIPARYRGDDGCGMLHPEFGYGEYLDEIAILDAKVKVGSGASYRIPLKTLKLGGFVVDAFPFVENFQHLTSLHLEHGCVDAGLVRPKGRVFEILVIEMKK